MIGWLGAQYGAAHQIALSMAAFTYMAASGISAAATIRVGDGYGLKDWGRIRKTANMAITMVVVFMSLAALTFVVFRTQLPALYINDIEVLSIAASLLVIAALFQLSDGIQVTCLGILRGINDVKVPSIISLCAYWVVALPVGYLLGFTFKMGVEGICGNRN